MNEEEAKQCLRDIAKYGGVLLSDHCEERMTERQIDMNDILNVLETCEVESLEFDPEYDNWKCKVVGSDIDGEEVDLVASIYGACQTIRCISLFGGN